MHVSVKLFASFREQYGFAEKDLEVFDIAEPPEPTPVTVKDIWQKSTQQQVIPDNMLAAVNHEYVDLQTIVCDADEVAFFPPVTGG